MSFSPLGNMALPFARRGAGRRSEFGTHVPPGARVAAYVHHSGDARVDDLLQSVPVVKDLRDGVAVCRPNYGDVVFVLPGHAQNVDAADWFGADMKAGAKIIGLGEGNLRPTLTWTIAGSTLLLDEANVTLDNFRLLMDPGAGTVNVAAPITCSAAGCRVSRCFMRMGTDANSKVTIGFTTTAAADDLTISECEVLGATAAEATTLFQFVGADNLKLLGNVIVGATSAVGVGCVRFLTTASLNILMLDNFIRNNKAASTAAVTGLTGTTGFVDRLIMGTLADGAAQLVLGNAAGAWGGNADGMMFGLDVGVVNLAGEAAARATPLSA